MRLTIVTEQELALDLECSHRNQRGGQVVHPAESRVAFRWNFDIVALREALEIKQPELV